MEKKEFYSKMDEIFELDTGTITGTESLSDNLLINSLSMLGLILVLDKYFGIQMKPDEIIKMDTINALFHRIQGLKTH